MATTTTTTTTTSNRHIELGKAILPAALGAAIGGLGFGRKGVVVGGVLGGGASIAVQAVPDTARSSAATTVRKVGARADLAAYDLSNLIEPDTDSNDIVGAGNPVTSGAR